MTNKGINIFLKIKPVLTMPILGNLKVACYILSVFTNQILLYIFKILKFKFK
jgi:hypothetical protein